MLSAGLLNAARSYVEHNGNDSKMQDYRYQCALRLEQWQTLEKSTVPDHSYHGHQYAAICYMRTDNQEKFQQSLEGAYSVVCDNLQKIGTESSRAIYERLGRLRTLREIELYKDVQNGKVSLQTYLSGLSSHDRVPIASFNVVEPTRFQRCLLSSNEDSSASFRISLDYIETCISNGKHQWAWNRQEQL